VELVPLLEKSKRGEGEGGNSQKPINKPPGKVWYPSNTFFHGGKGIDRCKTLKKKAFEGMTAGNNEQKKRDTGASR